LADDGPTIWRLVASLADPALMLMHECMVMLGSVLHVTDIVPVVSIAVPGSTSMLPKAMLVMAMEQLIPACAGVDPRTIAARYAVMPMI
jgi:hypothetical protein